MLPRMASVWGRNASSSVGLYGIDAGFRDPSGNHIRLTQVTMAGV